MAQDAGDVSRREYPHAVGVDQPVEAVLETDTLDAVVVRRLRHRADHRVETGRIPTAGQDADTFDGRHRCMLTSGFARSSSSERQHAAADLSPSPHRTSGEAILKLPRLQPAVYNDGLCGTCSKQRAASRPLGPLAQLGERRVRNAEVVGSSPMRSTTYFVCYVGVIGGCTDPSCLRQRTVTDAKRRVPLTLHSHCCLPAALTALHSPSAAIPSSIRTRSTVGLVRPLLVLLGVPAVKSAPPHPIRTTTITP